MSNVQTCCEWVLLVPDIQPDTSNHSSSVGAVIQWVQRCKDRGSQSKCGVILLDFQKEAFPVTEGLVESSPGIAELRLQGLSL